MTERALIKKKVLAENDRLAAEIRQLLCHNGVLALNLVSSPGSGKTSLLEKTLLALKDRISMALIAGDVQTENDAVRLIRAGGEVVRPIVTGGACHLNAAMIKSVLAELNLDRTDVLFIENVGNLVCPASYDLGEQMKIVVMSTTEGDDKPLKYPAMFRRSSLMIINKIDLLGLSDFDLDRARQNARTVNSGIEIMEISCRTGEGLDRWFNWLQNRIDTQRLAKTDDNAG